LKPAAAKKTFWTTCGIYSKGIIRETEGHILIVHNALERLKSDT
jgi:hypothetical protein